MKINPFSRDSKSSMRLLAIYLLSGLALWATAKESLAQERGFQPGAAYAVSDIEAINADNGNMIVEIPLAGLPAGRGGVPGFRLNLVYNSKLHDQRVETITEPGTGNEVAVNFLGPSDLGGWHYNYETYYDLRLINRFTTEGQYPCVCNLDYSKNAYSLKLMLVFPDGGEHVFRPVGYTDLHHDDYFHISPNGEANVASCGTLGTDSQACSFGTTQATTGGMTYYSVDGTFMRLFVPYSPTGAWDSNWTLSFPDGRRLINVNGQRTMYDRNNNPINTGLTGSLGRSITIQHNSSTDEDHIFVTGANQQQLEWIVKWRTIYVSRPYISTVASSGQERGNRYPQTYTNEARVVERITLPAQAGSLTYTFGYSASDQDPYPGYSRGWGELNSITLPTGAQVNYRWAFDDDGDTIEGRPPLWNWVLANRPGRKDLTYLQQYDGISTPTTETWLYSRPSPLGGTFSSTGPDGTVTTSTSFLASRNPFFAHRSYKTEHPDGSVTERLWAENRPEGVPLQPKAINPYVQAEFTSIKDANGNFVKTAIKDYKYDKNGNLTRVDEYDWIDFSRMEWEEGGPKPLSRWQWQGLQDFLKKTTSNSYYNPTPDASDTTTITGNLYYFLSAPLLRTAVKDTEITVGAQKFARTEFFYDDPLTTGNLIQQKSWDSQKAAYSNPLDSGDLDNSVSVSTQYNQYGSPILTTDARQVQSQLIYGPVGGFSDLYPTEIKTALGTAVQRWEMREYDFNTALVTRVTDGDNHVSRSTQYDDLGRPTLVRTAENRLEEAQTSTQYFDAERRVVVRSDLNLTGDGKLASIQHYDQLGRVRLTRQLEGEPTTGNLADETVGIKVQTRYIVNNPCQPDYTPQCVANNITSMAQYVVTSNPYRAGTSASAGSESTMGWTRSKSDNTGRLVEVETLGGATLPAPLGNNGNSTGATITSYDGMFTKVTDPAGKVGRSKLDGLGRLVRVDEPSDANNTLDNGSPDFPTQATNYEYDALGKLTVVSQGNQERRFSYSSLGRLISATNPESGTNNYAYYEDGTLKTRTEPRLVTNTSTRRAIEYVYDELGRVTSRSYNDGTPDVSYGYDASNVPFSRGRLTVVSSSVSSYSYGEYDALGRVKAGRQTTDGQSYPMSYGYNLAGSMISQVYPSGRTFNTEVDGAGRIAGVKSGPTSTFYYAGGAGTDPVNRVQYSAAGAVQAMKLGNGLWEHANFNSRLQQTQIGLGATSADSGVLKLDYNYGEVVNGVLDPARNNGNVGSLTITAPGAGSPIAQSYRYDALNRLDRAQEAGPNGWTQTFTYDRFGNRSDVDTVDNPAYRLPTQAPEIDVNTNRIKTLDAHNQPTGYDYDEAGNLKQEPRGSALQGYVYDAEHLVIQATNKVGGTATEIAHYQYDANGHRVKRIVGSATSVYVYNVIGQMVAEYSTDMPSVQENTSYITADMLGTPRVLTSSSGQVRERHDYLPFGEEIPAAYSNRANVAGYGADTLRQKFTSKERDIETGLDYFNARYYSSAQGRFTSPDEFKGGPKEISQSARDSAKQPLPYAEIAQPQSLNKYQYCYDNPLRFIDPDGHKVKLLNTPEADRKETKGRLLFNLKPSERQYFTVKYDKDKKEHFLVLKGNVDKALAQPHTKAFEYLVQTVRHDKTVGVGIADTYVSSTGKSQSIPNDAGGGITVYEATSNADVQVFLSRQGNPSPMYGITGNQISDPKSIIAAHEVLGHARLFLLGQPHGQAEAIDVENEVRKGRGLEERAP